MIDYYENLLRNGISRINAASSYGCWSGASPMMVFRSRLNLGLKYFFGLNYSTNSRKLRDKSSTYRLFAHSGIKIRLQVTDTNFLSLFFFDSSNSSLIRLHDTVWFPTARLQIALSSLYYRNWCLISSNCVLSDYTQNGSAENNYLLKLTRASNISVLLPELFKSFTGCI